MNSQLISWTIIGVAALLLALSVVILARLRWTQTRPLKACIVLSVFAHLLLLASVYFSRVFDLPFIPGGDQAIVVHLTLDDEEFLPEAKEIEPHAPAPVDTPSPSLTPLPEYVKVERVEPEPPEADSPSLAKIPQPALDAAEHLPESNLDETPEEATPREGQRELEDEAELPDAEPTPTPLETELPFAPPPLDPAPRDAAEPMVAPLETQPAPLLETTSVDETPDDSPVDEMPVVEVPVDIRPIEAPAELESANTNRDDANRQHPALEDTWQSAAAPDHVPRRYRDRIERPDQRELARRGGNPRTEAAVEAALNWLAGAQQTDGSWKAAQQGAGRGGWVEGQNRGTTGMQADTGITGLALLSFLGAGHTHQRGSYRENVGHAIDFLISQQDHRGSLGGNASIYARMYCHGIATLSLCEAAAISSDEQTRAAAQRAIDYTVSSQHRQTGGWRYSPGDRGDTSQFGWQLMALVSAREAGLQVPAGIDERLGRFLRSVQRGNHGGLASYRPGHAASRSMTAEALACRLFVSSGSPIPDREAAEYISSMRPGHGPRNFYYWYYATVALSQLNDEYWPAWNRALQKQLLPTQRRHGRMAGSWDPNTVWGGCGGRVYSTSLATLCLESYYRHAPANSDDRGNNPSFSSPVANGWSPHRGQR